MKLLHDQPLARKLAIVTTIKLLGLFVIWWVFFSNPSEEKLTPEQVSSAVLHPITRSTTMP